MRIAVGLEYDGGAYHGWQSQTGLNTLQQQVEKGLSRVANHAVEVICAGRTDTGVHALQQVIHFETTSTRSSRNWIFGANSHMAKDISLRWAKPISDDFHARFSAQRRRYQYVIYNHHIRPSHLRQLVTWSFRPLDVKLMQAAAKQWLGEHDFSSFRAIGCGAKSPVRTIYEFDVQRHGDFLIIEVCANAFLHHMIRNFAGVLMAIGAGAQPVQWAQEVLEVCDRTLGGITAPPYGLYLSDVTYPEEFEIPKVGPRPWFLLS